MLIRCNSFLALMLFTAALGMVGQVVDTQAGFTHYPAFGDRIVASGAPRVEAARDKGLIVELTVRCGRQVGIITFSKVEKLFCTPTRGCTAGFDRALQLVCESHGR